MSDVPKGTQQAAGSLGAEEREPTRTPEMICSLGLTGIDSADPLQRWSIHPLLGEPILMLDEALRGLSLPYTCPASKQDNLHSFLLGHLQIPGRMTSRKVSLGLVV